MLPRASPSFLSLINKTILLNSDKTDTKPRGGGEMARGPVSTSSFFRMKYLRTVIRWRPLMPAAPTPQSICLLHSMYYLGMAFYTQTILLDTKTITKASSDDEGRISLPAYFPWETERPQHREDWENTQVSAPTNSIILVFLVVFLCYPKPAHRQALDDHRVRHTEGHPVRIILSLSHLKCKSDIKMMGEQALKRS